MSVAGFGLIKLDLKTKSENGLVNALLFLLDYHAITTDCSFSITALKAVGRLESDLISDSCCQKDVSVLAVDMNKLFSTFYISLALKVFPVLI